MLTIIGEKINAINPQVRRAVNEQDEDFIRDLAVAQAEAGADVIDVNVGVHPGQEPEIMRWAVEVVQEVVDLPIAIDSPHPETVCAGLQVCRNRQGAWANSITLEESRLDGILPIVAESGCWVVGLCMDKGGVPATAAARLGMARRLIDEVERRGVSRDRLYLDALIEPISVKPAAGLIALKTIKAIRSELPGAKTVICLSAISFGLPARRLLNRTYLPLLLRSGVDAVFLDPLDSRLMATLQATRALLGRDAHGLEYIDAYRSKHLE